MLSAKDFAAAVEWNAARVNEYKSGGTGDGGKCDCIGLVIGALSHAGVRWDGTHGSNYAARYKTNNLRPIDSVNSLKLGELVYKAHAPGTEGYDAATINSKYANSGDLNDYYHVGVVTSVNPLRITHCTTVQGGIKVDNSLSNWTHHGQCTYVEAASNPDEGDGEIGPILKYAMVYAANGYPVNVRQNASTNSTIITKVPVGALVGILEMSSDWDLVTYDGYTGYMMTSFLLLQDDTASNSEEKVTIIVPRSFALDLYDACAKALGVGVG